MRSRFYTPLALTVILTGLYLLAVRNPIPFAGQADIREVLFGPDLSYLAFAITAALIVLGVRLLDAVIFDFVFSRRKNIIAPFLLREIISLALYFALFAWAISSIFDYSVAGFLTTTTVVAAVIGLALQDTLGNLFSGIALHMEHTYEVGDVIRSGEHIGSVENVNWRATQIRTFNSNVVVLPNSVIARERLEIHRRRELNARLVTVGIAYEHAPSQVIAVLEQAARNVRGVSPDIPLFARVSGFGDSSVQYEIKYWTRAYEQHQNIDADIRRAIWYALRRNRLTIPFPIRSYRRYETPEAMLEPPTGEALRQRLESIDVLAPLSPDELEQLAQATDVHTFAQGETILTAGEEGHSMFVVHSGTVAVRLPEDGGSREVAQLGPGSVFGEMALLTGESRTASVIALSDCEVLEIGKESLQPLLVQNPGLAASISAKIIERRDSSASIRKASQVDQQTLVSRIRSYFGL